METVETGRPRDERPDPAWVRGSCPECGQPLVSNCYYIGGRGYIILWECWQALGAGEPRLDAQRQRRGPGPGASRTCDYRRVL